MIFSKFSKHVTGTVFGFLLSSILVGCSLYPDVNTDPAKNNKATFRQDALDCAQAYPEAGSGVHIKQRISCMNLKGWQ
ncbi:MAG: hypothetical protein B7Y05_22370 [Polynucleobacter sp. 24-46-87]|uniref:hypothetical protein n=1 Tax=Polynucleobacter sp. 39-46-10 TaxID=1970428 RepID=UPI000BD3A23A|nr:hypothetical protein [Polynucleobacter sp. 39-46-10]OZA05015.1 MAG: hypothetical protein B7Y05_22370 [Polynucleobacter sp. 24-46-87]OZA75075.1 MAG: hypothetical protein B7X71_12205 [Polynucleobacter sp. 39-46-10]